ncbi:molybdopterin-dependent oxidoreductase [Streptomyces sviceus]|uniref:molybdopterin-dependent oxidoreductase n=1 Tax=Streptomyces sviceus TaxID=285530 RepID=UPI0036999453
MTENEKEPRSPSGPARPLLAALGGVLAGCAALAVAEAVAGGVRAQSGPVVVVGGAAIDRTPAAVKDWAIRHFGTDDKLVLQLGILAVLALFALALGIVALRFRRTGSAGVLLFGAVGAVAATSRPDSTGAADTLPSVAGAVAGAVVLYVLAGRLALRDRGAAAAQGDPRAADDPSRGPVAGRRRARAVGTGSAVPAASGLPGAAAVEGVIVPGEVPARAVGNGSAGPAASDLPAAAPASGRVGGWDCASECVRGRGAAAVGGSRVVEGVAVPGEVPAGAVGAGSARSAVSGTSVSASEADHAPVPAGARDWDRRGFVLAAGGTAAASAGAGLLGRYLSRADGRDAVASRAAVVLPRPASPAPAVPRGAGLRIPGASPFVTPNGAFYRVDTALVVPKVDATSWRLRLHGRGVARPVVLSYDDLLRRELVERDITLTCVSNEVGGSYVGNARWIGVRLADLLAECGVRPPSEGGPADQLVARSVDGMTIGSPVEDLMDGRDALLALGMNGEPLPFAHGFPVRMVVPGLYGFVSACKWIKDIELTTFDSYDPYWVKRGWAREAPIKTQSRIDTPKPFARPKAGTVMVAGVAWAQHRGIDKVEIRVDDGPWQQARPAAEDTRDTWRHWSFAWQATKGGHTLTVRATDRTGAVQTDERARTIPDGASGWHSVVVTVE